jgi:hypothetical protein
MPKLYGVAQGSAPATKVADAGLINPVTDEFGFLHQREELRAAAEQGTYYKVTTLNTSVTMSATQTTFSDLGPSLILRNMSSNKKIIPHYIKLICAANSGASTAQLRFAIITDVTNKYSSGGSDLTLNIFNASSAAGNASAVDLRFGTLTAAAATAKRTLSTGVLKVQAAPCLVVGDEYILRFGEGSDSVVTNGTAAVSITKHIGPCVIAGLNHSLLLHLWGFSVAAPSFEMEAAWWER